MKTNYGLGGTFQLRIAPARDRKLRGLLSITETRSRSLPGSFLLEKDVDAR